MRLYICIVMILASAAATGRAAAQTPVEPPAQWEVKIGAAFVGTSGNFDTKSTGANFDARRDWDVWRIESSASAVATSDKGVTTAEQFLGALLAKRDITKLIAVTSGIKLERDQLSGLNF